MKASLFPTIEERVQLFKQYYKMELSRPLLGFFLGSEYPLHRYPASQGLPVNRALVPEDFPVDEYVRDSQQLFERHEACGGDFIWSGSAFWGIPWLEAALGCPIIADHTTGSISSRKPASFVGPRSIPSFSTENPWVVKTREFLEKLAEGSGGRWPIGTTRMRGIADLLMALYGSEEFLFVMLEKGDEVREVCKRLTDFWIAYAQFQLELIPLFHGGVGSFYYNMWAPAGTVWHQEDATALMSPGLYEDFILPWDQKIVESLPGCIVHQHSIGYIPTEHYLDMGVLALEMHIDAGGPSARELAEVHRSILGSRPLLIWGKMTAEDLDWIFSQLPTNGLAVQQVVSSPKEAHQIYRRYMNC